MLASRFQSRDDDLQQRLVELVGGCIGVTGLHDILPAPDILSGLKHGSAVESASLTMT